MKRSSIVAAGTAAALLIAAPIADAAKLPSAQYRGTVKNGGKFVVDVNGGKVTTVQAYYPVACQQSGSTAGGEILLENLSVKLTKGSGGAYSFTLKMTKGEQNGNPKGVIKGTWNKAATKVTGTINLAAAAYTTACSDSGGPASNPPATFSATQQPS
jgi:hypothetical protein